MFALATATVPAATGCGPKSGGGGPRVDLGAYPALKWAPADVAYAGAMTRIDGAIAAAHDAVEALGIVGDFDPSELEGEIQRYLGIDPLSVDDLAAAGVDVAGGGVVFAQGFSPTFVFRLADPAAMQSRIDAQREKIGSGAAIGVAVKDNIEVYTALGDRNLHTHWAIDGAWMWVHFEIVDEHEPELGWFEASRAANGALAKDPDFGWARAQAEHVQPGAALAGLIRPDRLAARVAKLARDPEATACMALVTPRRAALAIGASGDVSEGHVVIDTNGGGAAIGAMTLPVPAGWAAARGQAPIAVEWNLDAARLATWFSACNDHPARMVAQLGLRSFRAFLIDLEPDDLSGHGAIAADLSSRKQIDRMLDITGRSMFEKKQKFGPLDGVHLNAPMLPAVDYIITADRAFAAAGDGVLATVVGDGSSTVGVLAAVDLRPAGLSDKAWDFLLEHGAGVSRDTARDRTLRRLKRWKHATIDVTRDGDLVYLRARGER